VTRLELKKGPQDRPTCKEGRADNVFEPRRKCTDKVKMIVKMSGSIMDCIAHKFAHF